MQHDYSIMTQNVSVFLVFALVGPVIGVTFGDSFGVGQNSLLLSEPNLATQIQNSVPMKILLYGMGR